MTTVRKFEIAIYFMCLSASVVCGLNGNVECCALWFIAATLREARQ